MSKQWNSFWMIRDRTDNCPVTSNFGSDIFDTSEEAQETLDWVEEIYPGRYELAKYQYVPTGPYDIAGIRTGLDTDDAFARWSRLLETMMATEDLEPRTFMNTETGEVRTEWVRKRTEEEQE